MEAQRITGLAVAYNEKVGKSGLKPRSALCTLIHSLFAEHCPYTRAYSSSLEYSIEQNIQESLP